ncbi:hypothetical protein [Deinococcus sp. PEB2-63]
MTTLPAVHPLNISRLRDFAHGYLQEVQRLNLDTSPATRRHLPELFLTFNEQGPSTLTLHVFPDPALDQWKELHSKLGSLVRQHLDGDVRGVIHDVEERASMYDTLQRAGPSRYLHPAALRALSEMQVGRDAYGRIYGGLLTLHVLGGALLIAGFWLLPDGSGPGELVYLSVFWVVLVAISYLIVTLPLRLPRVYTALARPRLRAFAAILADCQVAGRQGIDEGLAAELPASVMQRLSQLPAERPTAQDVLLRDEWRLAELWDLAHHAALELAKTPESSPAFATATRHTEQLLDSVVEAFAERHTNAPGTLHHVQEKIELHARALGVSVPPARTRHLSPLSPASGETP